MSDYLCYTRYVHVMIFSGDSSRIDMFKFMRRLF